MAVCRVEVDPSAACPLNRHSVAIESQTEQSSTLVGRSRHGATRTDRGLPPCVQRRSEPGPPTRGIGPVDRLFQDKVGGGSRANRAGLAECLSYVRAGDNVRVASTDRLARSLIDLQQLVDEILAKGISVHFVKEGQTYFSAHDDSMSRLMLQILGAIAEF